MKTLMAETKKSLTVQELKRLLIELKEQPDICIRYRLLGELWQDSFVRVISLYHDCLFLQDENHILRIPNISNIIQFEIDRNFLGLQRNYHYDVVLDHQVNVK